MPNSKSDENRIEFSPALSLLSRVLLVTLVATSAFGVGILPVASSVANSPTETQIGVGPLENATEERDDPTRCNGGLAEYGECEVDEKSTYVIRVVTAADPESPVETTESTTEDVLVLVHSVDDDVEHLERIIRFRVSDLSPTVVEYFLDRGIETVLANERVVNNHETFVGITSRTADRTVAFERERVEETQRTGPDRAAHHAEYSVTKTRIVVSATEKTVPRLVDTSDETVQRSPARAQRFAEEMQPAAVASGERALSDLPPFVESVPEWIEYRSSEAPDRAAQIGSDASNVTRTVDDPTDEGPGCDNGGVVEYSRCEAEYKAFVALYLAEHTDTDRPVETALLYVNTAESNASDVQENDLHYYDNQTEDPLVAEGTKVGKHVTAPVRSAATDNYSDCSGEEANYTRCEAEYKSHVLLTSGIDRTYPTDITRSIAELTPVLEHLALDAYANDVPYYSEHAKDRSAAMRDIPQENGTCVGHVPRYTRCEAEYKADFIGEDTVNRTYPGDVPRTANENLAPLINFVNDIYFNDYPYYDNATYHPAIEGGAYIAKNASYPTRETITADSPDCSGESIEYTRCRTEYKSSVILEDVINRTYPADITRTEEENMPIALELLQATIEDVNYYYQSEESDSVNRTFYTIDGITNSKPFGPVLRGRTREAKWRSSEVRSVPDDDPNCSGDVVEYTGCEAQYKSHVVLNDIFESTYPADTHRTYYENLPTILNLTSDVVENDVPYYEDQVDEVTPDVAAVSGDREDAGMTRESDSTSIDGNEDISGESTDPDLVGSDLKAGGASVTVETVDT